MRLGKPIPQDLARTIFSLSENNKTIDVKIGRYGIYAQDGANRVTIDNNLPPSEFDIDIIAKQIKEKLKGDKEVGTHPNTKAPIYLKTHNLHIADQSGHS